MDKGDLLTLKLIDEVHKRKINFFFDGYLTRWVVRILPSGIFKKISRHLHQ